MINLKPLIWTHGYGWRIVKAKAETVLGTAYVDAYFDNDPETPDDCEFKKAYIIYPGLVLNGGFYHEELLGNGCYHGAKDKVFEYVRAKIMEAIDD